MKQYRQLLKELPSSKVVFAFGRFQPPTAGHELIVKTVKQISETQNSDHVIFAADDLKENLLSQEKKSHYMNIMFPGTNVHFTDMATIVEAAKELNKKYKNVVMVTTADCKEDYQKILNNKNGKDFFFETIEVITAGDVNPDKNQLKESAKKGNYDKFKKYLPTSLREIDSRRLMNDMRKSLGLDIIKEDLHLVKDNLREQYFRKEIFNIGDIVECNSQQYTIVKRGTNHLLLKEDTGNLVSKWIQDVTMVKEGNMIHEELTDKTLRPTDKIKVARIIADMLGVTKVEATANPENLVNTALRRVKSKALNAEGYKILEKMLQLATDVGIVYDTTLMPAKLKEARMSAAVKLQRAFEREQEKSAASRERAKQLLAPKKPEPVKEETELAPELANDQNLEDQLAAELDLTDEQIDHIIQVTPDEDIEDEFEEEDYHMIDDETGEPLSDEECQCTMEEQAILEVLSRTERMRAKVRFAKSKSKREVKASIALKSHAPAKKVNQRARRLAIKLMKKRMLRGRDYAKISVGEKERIERVITKRKQVIDRVALKLIPRIRNVEKARLSHHKYNASSNNNVSF